MKVRACIDCMTAATLVASAGGRVGSGRNHEDRGRLRMRSEALAFRKCQLRWCGWDTDGSETAKVSKL